VEDQKKKGKKIEMRRKGKHQWRNGRNKQGKYI
jgi:hypothetical protein